MRLAFAPLAVAVLAVFPAPAAADPVVGTEVDVFLGDVPGAGFRIGPGAGLRAGWAFDLALGLRLEPELAVSRHALEPDGCDSLSRCEDVALTRLSAGARLSLDTPVAPGVYVRAGLATAAPDGAGSRDGTTAELGLLLDLRVLPFLEAGLHVATGSLSFDGAADGTFFGGGLHAALLL